MKRSNKLVPGVEGMEDRQLLSGGGSPFVLTQRAFNQTVALINTAAGTFAKTHNETLFVAQIGQISYHVPYGHQSLLPIWTTDVAIYNPAVRGSGLAMVSRLKVDLVNYVRAGVASGTFFFR